MKSKLFFLLLTVVIAINGCKKETVNQSVVATVNTSSVSAVSVSSAVCGGTVINNGGSTVNFRGVCWSTSPNPTILNDKTADGIDTGAFTSTITGLKTNTLYFTRAYANNKAGTTYGNEVSFTTTTVVVGDAYQGGIVAYVLQHGDTGYISGEIHGFIAAQTSQSSGIQWYNGANIATGATARYIGSGRANTDSIVRVQGPGNYAAKLCDDLVLNGYSDWYLPSNDELWKLYTNRAYFSGLAYSYWSSSENSPVYTWIVNFTTGISPYYEKYNAYAVRAIRSF